MDSPASPKRLILRLSSLGDVILSSAALEAPYSTNGVDWVVAKEYAEVLRGHPRIIHLWEYDRKAKGAGAFAWFRFARRLWDENYSEIFDLHGSIRTLVLRVLFLIWGAREKRKFSWSRASKQRVRTFGLLIFKRWWPKRFRCQLQVSVFGQLLGGSGEERPNLSHLLNPEWVPPKEIAAISEQSYVCVMPGSNWPGKTWAGEKYFAVLKTLGVFPVVMGQPNDPECSKLTRLLVREEVPHYSGVGKWSLLDVAQVLSRANAYLGSDTGLAHLAEAVGTPIAVIYGPTSPGLGFEPWRQGSRTIGVHLSCRPCGKIGKYCFRPVRKFLCLKMLEPVEVLRQLKSGGP